MEQGQESGWFRQHLQQALLTLLISVNVFLMTWNFQWSVGSRGATQPTGLVHVETVAAKPRNNSQAIAKEAGVAAAANGSSSHDANETATTPWVLNDNLQVIIPYPMILIKSSLLWCPNAKSGTTTVYDILIENKLLPEGFSLFAKRCTNDDCPNLASKALLNWDSPKPLSFIIVRNPFDRIRSCYSQLVLNGRIRDENGERFKSFSQFVNNVERNPTRNAHFVPTSKRCLTGGGGQKPFKYDYVLRLEEDNIPARLAEIFRRAGIDLPSAIKQQPQNQNKKLEHTTDALVDFYREAAKVGNVTMDELVAKVGRIYKDDIETFGYSFPTYDK